MMSRSGDEKPLKGVLRDFLKIYGLEDKMREMRIKNAWEEIMGEYVARKTQGIQVKDRKLVIRLESGVLKEEFSYSKTKIVQLINQSLEANVIDEVEIY
jgi:non-canonical (house-cleaning) NTP pyrophosphatase